MAAKKEYRVTATMIVAKVPGAQGGEVYLRKGRMLPAAVTADEVKRLLALGLIELAAEIAAEPSAQVTDEDAAKAATAAALQSQTGK